jgi:hypothetical protein
MDGWTDGGADMIDSIVEYAMHGTFITGLVRFHIVPKRERQIAKDMGERGNRKRGEIV